MEIVIPEKIFGINSNLIKLLIAPIILTIIVLVVINSVMLPRIKDIGVVNKDINKVLAETKKIQEKINYLESVPQDELKKNEGLLASSMLYEKDAYYLVSVIRNIADRYGFMIQGFSISPGKVTGSDQSNKNENKNANKKVPVTLSLMGPKSKYLDFINGLENSLPLLTLDKFEMKGKASIAEMNLIVSAFYFSNESSAEVKNLTLNDLKLDVKQVELLKQLSSFENNRDVLKKVEAQTATRSGILYGRNNPFIP